VSKPVTGESARRLIEAVDGGGALSNPRSLAVADEVAEEWKVKKATNEQALRRN
jgi:hypothetical protein